MVTSNLVVRPADASDQQRLSALIHFEKYTHRHLDWRTPLDWLGSPYFWKIENQTDLLAALACPPDPEPIAWLRLFSVSESLPLRQAWTMLWDTAQTHLRGSGLRVAAIALSDWVRTLLHDSYFTRYEEIVGLEWRLKSRTIPMPKKRADVIIRDMELKDIPQVARVDASAFVPLWQNSITALEHALSQAGWATVAEINNGEVVGYQISTQSSAGAHLGRLAVGAEAHRMGIASALMNDLFQRATLQNIQHISVNTQSQNRASLAFYRKLGFERTYETYPVFVFDF